MTEKELKEKTIEYFKATYRQRRAGWFPYCEIDQDSILVITNRAEGKVDIKEDPDCNVRVYFEYTVINSRENEKRFDNFIVRKN